MTLTHIVSRFEVYEPSILEAITLFRKPLSNIKLWCTEELEQPDENLNITVIRPYAGDFPSGGDLIILGSYTNVGHWYRHSHFENVTLVHLNMTQENFYQTMHRLTQAGTQAVNIIYANQKIKQLIGLEGKLLFDQYNNSNLAHSKKNGLVRGHMN